MMEEKIEKTVCYNCEKAVYPDDDFCSHCGQANHPTKLTISVLLKDFFINFFNIDSRLFLTLRHVFLPQFLTKSYLAGKRKKYANPIRLFFIMIFICFAAFAYTLNEKANLDTLGKAKYDLDASVVKSEMLEDYNHLLDTMELTASQSALRDSITKHVFRRIVPPDSNIMDFKNMTIFGSKPDKYKITRKDAVNLSYDEIYEKYKIDDTQDRVIVTQLLKAFNDPAGTIRFIVSNSFWMIILNIIVCSFILKLLYIRRKRYFLEHIILQCNCHSLLFILITLYLLAINFMESLAPYFGILIALFFVYQFFIFWKFYKQGFFKSFIKYAIYLGNYLILLNLCAVFVALVSFIFA